MGTGKSSVGLILARMLDFTFVDTDVLIEERANQTIPEIFAASGEAAFRKLEVEVTREMEETARTVIATGGGLILNPDNLASLKKHALVACLWAQTATIYERVKSQKHRPLLASPDPRAKIEELLEARKPFYRQADVLVSSDFRNTYEVAQHVRHEFDLINRA